MLQVYKTSLPETMGGTEQVVRTLATQSHQHAVESEVVTLCADGRLAGISVQGPYTLHRFRRDFEVASMPVSLRLLRQFAALARRFDLIHYHFPWPFMDVLHLAGAARTPSVLTYHSDIVRQRRWLRLYRPLQQRFLERVDHIVATSPNYRATSPVLANFQTKLSVIPIDWILPVTTRRMPSAHGPGAPDWARGFPIRRCPALLQGSAVSAAGRPRHADPGGHRW